MGGNIFFHRLFKPIFTQGANINGISYALWGGCVPKSDVTFTLIRSQPTKHQLRKYCLVFHHSSTAPRLESMPRLNYI